MSRFPVLWSLLALALAGCGNPKPATAPAAPPAAAGPDAAALLTRAGSLFQALPAEMSSPTNPVTEAKIYLGRMLYFDPRLSLDQDLSCNSCHGLDTYGVDNQPTSPGHKGQRGSRNSPTAYNAALHVAQFWDGRAADVEAQAKGPVLNPIEMAMPDEATVVARLRAVPGYLAAFQAAFPGEADPISYDNMARAIGAFERRLVTPSPFDRFLAGDAAALDAAQLKGLQVFLDTGCAACHNGAGIGGGQFQKLGVVKAYPTTDQGRVAVTGNEADRLVFKVPSLRNIDKTGPYFHDGQVTALPQAVQLMAEHQLGRTLSDADAQAIVDFLGSLTGPLPTDYIKPPVLPGAS